MSFCCMTQIVRTSSSQNSLMISTLSSCTVFKFHNLNVSMQINMILTKKVMEISLEENVVESEEIPNPENLPPSEI